jgi:hypothetical protein
VTGTGPWNWSCTGLYGGTNASCSANIQTYTVSTSVLSGIGTISPQSPTVNHGSQTVFTIEPDLLYIVDGVGGTCGGQLAGNTYTTNAITADCTVEATFIVSGGAGGFTQGVGFSSVGALSFLFNNNLFRSVFRRRRKSKGKCGDQRESGRVGQNRAEQ